MNNSTLSAEIAQKEYGSERDVERITGRRVRTLQKDRLFGRGFPFYRVGRQIRYDLNEIRALVRATRIQPGDRL